MLSWPEVRPCAVTCHEPGAVNVTDADSAPVPSACSPGSAVTRESGPVIQSEIGSFAVKPLAVNVTAVPTVAGVALGPVAPDADPVDVVPAVVAVPPVVPTLYLPTVSLPDVIPCAVTAHWPAVEKVTLVENAPVPSAEMPGRAVTPPPGAVSQREICSLAVKPLPEKVVGEPSATGVPFDAGAGGTVLLPGKVGAAPRIGPVGVVVEVVGEVGVVELVGVVGPTVVLDWPTV